MNHPLSIFPSHTLLVGGLILLLSGAASCPAEDGDWQQWTDATWSQGWGEGFDASLRWEGRFNDDLSHFSYYEVESMLTWRYSPRWNFAMGYERDEFLRPTGDVVHVPSVSTILKIPLQRWQLDNVFRAEYDVSENPSQDPTFMYRNRIDLTYRWKWGGRELAPYLSEEWFLEEQRAGIVQNRLAIGINLPVTPHWNAGVYLMRFDEKTPTSWQWHPVLGVQVLAQF